MCMLMSPNCWWNESSQLHCFSIGLFKHGVLQVAGCSVFPYDFWSIEWVVLVNNLWSTLLYSRDLSFKHNLWRSTLATLTLIILFSKTLEFSKRNLFFKEQNDLKEKMKSSRFVKMKISKLINYSTNMCWSCQGTMVPLFFTQRDCSFEHQSPSR